MPTIMRSHQRYPATAVSSSCSNHRQSEDGGVPAKPLIANCTFAFNCPRRWEDLIKGDDRKVRSCLLCKRDVHLVETQAEWDQRLAQGACVAVTAAETFWVGTPSGSDDIYREPLTGGAAADQT